MNFSDRLIDILNTGALAAAMSVGYRLGLFEAMDRLPDPATPAEIAAEAGLDERYVREWLGAMTAGGIVLLETGSGENRHLLPASHGDVLTRRAGPRNLGVYLQEIPLLTRTAMDRVEESFRTGEGVHWRRYREFHDFMAELAEAKHRRTLVDEFLPSVDGGELVRRLEDGMRVLDLGCGAGTAALLMAQAFPRSRITGLDINEYAVDLARTGAELLGLDNVRFVVADAAAVTPTSPLAGRFDYVTAFDAIHDQADPAAALCGAKALLAPGGRFSMVDIKAGSRLADNLTHPMAPFLYTVSLLHCLPVGLMDGGAGLGMMWGRERAVTMLAEAGLAPVRVLEMHFDPFNVHYYYGGESC